MAFAAMRFASAGQVQAANAKIAVACPTEVRVVYPDIDATPFINGRGVTIPQDPGLLIDWVKSAIAKSPCQVKLSLYRLPTVRTMMELNVGRYDILLAAATDNPLASKLRFPMQEDGMSPNRAVASGALMLYALPVSAAAWDGSTLNLPPPATVGVVRGQAAQFVAAQNGWRTDESPDAETNFRKLLLGRVAAVLEQRLVATDLVKTLPDQSVKMLAVPVKTLNYYSPVTTDFYSRYPQFSEQFWSDLCNESHKVLKGLPKCADK
jgi:ABC-type amino acid transport substrate-binding protein